MTMATLFHVHDPMCSWCWGFKPAWTQVKQGLPTSVSVKYLLGGLAPDSEEPMPESMQQMLQQTWQRIQQSIPGTEFNFDFWTENTPRRSTYPACRAVLAASSQNSKFEEAMTTAIQQAYYLKAKNPSDHDVLVELASEIGCDASQFAKDLNSPETHERHKQHQSLMQQLGAQGFPSLFFVNDKNICASIPLNYNQPSAIVNHIESLLSN